MCTIREMLDRLNSFDPLNVTAEIISENTDKIANIVREQLMEGKDSLGQLITPTYSQDPFFKKDGAAQRYAQWKADLFPNSTKPFDTPNLIITGKFHDSINVTVTGFDIIYDTNINLGYDILAKYGDKVIGLNPDGKIEAWEEIVRDRFVKALADTLQCELG